MTCVCLLLHVRLVAVFSYHEQKNKDIIFVVIIVVIDTIIINILLLFLLSLLLLTSLSSLFSIVIICYYLHYNYCCYYHCYFDLLTSKGYFLHVEHVHLCPKVVEDTCLLTCDVPCSYNHHPVRKQRGIWNQ